MTKQKTQQKRYYVKRCHMPPLDESIGDPILAVQEEMKGSKYCTTCGERKDLSEFNKDISKPDGYRDTCSKCRADIRQQQKQDQLDRRLAVLEEEGLNTLGTMTSGGTFDPHVNEVFEAMMRPFGGVNGWAKHMFATYLAAPPGSSKRIKIHDMMMNLAAKVTKLGLAERKLDMMEEKDLIDVMGKYIHEFQDANRLPPSALPGTNNTIIDVGPGKLEVSPERAAAIEKMKQLEKEASDG